jgi:DNA-binding IclR family transcriptional regulator
VAGNSIESGRSVTSKVTAILTAFTDGNMHSLTEIARFTSLPISTAHRLSTELAAWHVLERTEDGLYRVGLPLRMIGGHAGNCHNLWERAPYVMEDLSSATRHDVRLGVLQNFSVSYIEKLAGHRPVSAWSDAATLPIHATAVGKALLAFSSPRIVDMIIAKGLKPYTAYTLCTADRFRRGLTVTRLTRMAVSRWELELGNSAVAMPVFGPGGKVIAALEIRVHDLRSDLQVVRPALSVAARSLSRELASESPNRWMSAPGSEHRTPITNGGTQHAN